MSKQTKRPMPERPDDAEAPQSQNRMAAEDVCLLPAARQGGGHVHGARRRLPAEAGRLHLHVSRLERAEERSERQHSGAAETGDRRLGRSQADRERGANAAGHAVPGLQGKRRAVQERLLPAGAHRRRRHRAVPRVHGTLSAGQDAARVAVRLDGAQAIAGRRSPAPRCCSSPIPTTACAKASSAPGAACSSRSCTSSTARNIRRAEDFDILDGSSGQAAYTDWRHNSVLITIDEAKSSPTSYRRGERSAVYEVLKNVVDPAPKRCRFKSKYGRPFDGMSYCLVHGGVQPRRRDRDPGQ